jgi:hypothetical protein
MRTYRGLTPLRSIAEAIAATTPSLIISGDDLATRHLHDLHDQPKPYRGDPRDLRSLIERSLGTPDGYPVARARAAFMEMAREQEVRVPDTRVIGDVQELKDWISQAGFPTVLKADGTSGGDGVRVSHTLAQAERDLKALQAPTLWARALKRALVDHDRTLVWPALSRHRSAVSAQAFIEGHEATSTVACWQGEVRSMLHFEVIEKCHAAGHSTVLRLIDNSEMSAAAERMARRLNLSGLYGFDFMVEANTGAAYLIEMNPRATQVGHLTLGPARDLPAALYAAVTGEPIRVAPKVTESTTIALFPQEWARNPDSEFCRSGYHDVPWGEPALLFECIRRGYSRKTWFSRNMPGRQFSVEGLCLPVGVTSKQRAVGLGRTTK